MLADLEILPFSNKLQCSWLHHAQLYTIVTCCNTRRLIISREILFEGDLAVLVIGEDCLWYPRVRCFASVVRYSPALYSIRFTCRSLVLFVLGPR